MIKILKDTTTAGIQAALTEARHRLGWTSGMVFTLCVVAELHDYTRVLAACTEAGREHPSRMIIITKGAARANRLDAEIHVGEDVPGEVIALRFQGELADHQETVVLPLLLPDSPVIAWWPGAAPVSLAEDPIGRLANRRISDAMGTRRPIESLLIRADHLAPGDTDLAWTRLTPWRALLAASLDQVPAEVNRAVIAAEHGNASAALLAAWLEDRLCCEVTEEVSSGPGITAVTLSTRGGDICLRRTTGDLAQFTSPNTPTRSIALRRRSVSQLIVEELRRLDHDDILASAMARLVARASHPNAAAASPRRRRSARGLGGGKRSLTT